jgi:hypothetical protein
MLSIIIDSIQYQFIMQSISQLCIHFRYQIVRLMRDYDQNAAGAAAAG